MAFVPRRAEWRERFCDGRFVLGAYVEPLQKLHLKVSRLLKSFLNQYLTWLDVYSHPVGSAGKQRTVRSLKISPFKACSGLFSQVEKRYALPGLHVGFCKIEKTAELSGFSTRND